MKIYTKEFGHMTNMAAMQDLPRLFKLRLWVDLDPFYAKVKFGHIGFLYGKK